MSRLRIQPGRRWRWDTATLQRLESSRLERGRPNPRWVRDSLAVLLDGEDLARDAPEDRPFVLLLALLQGTAHLHEGRSTKLALSFCDSAWELSLLPRHAGLTLSFFSSGRAAAVRAHEEPLTWEDWTGALRVGTQVLLEDVRSLPEHLQSMGQSLEAGLRALPSAPPVGPREPHPPPDPAADERLTLEGAAGDLVLRAQVRIVGTALRSYDGSPAADLHSLLLPGHLSFSAEGAAQGPEGYPVLLLRGLAEGLEELLEAAQGGEALRLPRISDGGVALELSGVGQRLRLQPLERATGRPLAPARETDPLSLAEALLGLTSALRDAAQRRNPQQRRNRALTELLDDLRRLRRYAAELRPSPPPAPASAAAPPSPPLRSPFSPPPVPGLVRRVHYEARWELPWYSARPPARLSWVAGGILLVGPDRAAWIDPQTGALRLDRRAEAGALMAATCGPYLALLDEQGRLALHDLSSRVPAPRWRMKGLTGATLAPAGAVRIPPQREQAERIVLHLGEQGLLALDPATARVQWCAAGAARSPASLSSDGAKVFVAGDGRSLRAHDLADGRLLWRASLPAVPRLAPTVLGPLLLLPLGERLGEPARLLAFASQSGHLEWQAELGEGRVGGLSSDGSRAFASAQDGAGGRVSAFDLGSGAALWSQRVDGLGFDAPGGPLLAEDRLFLRSDHGRAHAFDPATGQRIWATHTCPQGALQLVRSVPPDYARGLLFVASDTLHVLRPRDGGEVGCVDLGGRIPELLLLGDGETVWLADEEGVVGLELRRALGVV